MHNNINKSATRFHALPLLPPLAAIALIAAISAAPAQDVNKPAEPAASAPSAPAAPATNAQAPASTAPAAAAPKPRKPQTAAPQSREPGTASTWSANVKRDQVASGSPIKREPIKEPVNASGCRGAIQPGKPYFVEFRSRTAASYGHTFVFYGQLGGGNKFASFKVAGLHPKGDDPSTYIQGHWMPVEAETGVSYGDLDEQYLTARFCVTLDAAQFAKVSAYIRNLQATTTKWHAGTYNCNSFASDIAKSIGLDSPNPNAYLPEAFIKRLAESNRNFNASKRSDLGSSFSWPNFSSLGSDSNKPRR